MVEPTTAVFVVVFMLATVGFSAGAAWISLRDPAHTPEPLRDDGTG